MTRIPELEQQLVEAARRQGRPQAERHRWLGRRPWLRGGALGVSALALAGGAAGATSLFDTGDPQLKPYFEVLRRDRTPADSMGAFGEQIKRERAGSQRIQDEVAKQLGRPLSPSQGINYDAARRVRTSNPDVQAWVAPGQANGAACLIVRERDGTPHDAGCLSRNEVDRGIAPTTTSRAHNDVDVYGLVPDGVDQVTLHFRDGSSQTVRVVDNTYLASGVRRLMRVTYAGPGGPTSIAAPSA